MNAQTKIEPPDTLFAAMAKAFRLIEGATKDSSGQVGTQKYKYADLTSVIEALKPALAANNLFFTQHPQPCEGGVMIETMLHHASGESMSLGKLFVPANRQDAQSYGSALTYARRYALVTAFGVPVEDDDGNAAVKAGPEAKRKEPTITDDQVTQLMAMLPAAKLNTNTFCQTMGCKDVPSLPAAKFDEAIDRINARLALLAKQETDAKAKEMA